MTLPIIKAAFVGSNDDTRNLGNQGKVKIPHPNAAGTQGFPTDQCQGSYNDVKKGIIWCYSVGDIFKVLPKLEKNKYALPLQFRQEATKNNAQYLRL